MLQPLQIDFYPDIQDVRQIIPYANEFNTFTFSEYNDLTTKNFTFNTGIGKQKNVTRDGILLTNVRNTKLKFKKLKNPYALIYVAQSIQGLDRCITSFVEMISKKYYKKYPYLDVVIPPWFVKERFFDKLKRKISKYYPNILIISKDKKIIVSEDDVNDNTLTFRCDILPVPNKEMLILMKNSIDDILLTGDQSITDAFSCCHRKNIFYQIAPWKKDLGKQLAKEMPNIYLKSVKTSCGTLRAIKYKSNYNKFVKKWDFRKRSKPKLDAIILSIILLKKSPCFKKLSKIIDNSKTLSSLQKRTRELEDNNLRLSKKHSRERKDCKYGIKKDGNCKKKPGRKKKSNI